MNIPASLIIDSDSQIHGKGGTLNGVISAKVTLTAEKLFLYHVSELPPSVMQDFLEKHPDRSFALVLKPFSELEKSVKDLDRLPIVIDHRFVWDDKDPAIAGWLKNIVADPTKKSLKAEAYFKVSKISPELAERIQIGEKIDVSVGGSAFFGEGGIYDGENFDFTQKDFQWNHLATLPYDQGRCGIEKCGVNVDKKYTIPTNLSHFASNCQVIFGDDNKRVMEVLDQKKPEDIRFKTNLSTIEAVPEKSEVSDMDIEELKKMFDAFADKNSSCAESLKKEIAELKNHIVKYDGAIGDMAKKIEGLTEVQSQSERARMTDALIKTGHWTSDQLKAFTSNEQLSGLLTRETQIADENAIGDQKAGFPKPDQKKTGDKQVPGAQMGFKGEK